jgi:hypothetical protein
VARAAPAPGDIIIIIDRPDPDLHRRPEPKSANNNSAKKSCAAQTA